MPDQKPMIELRPYEQGAAVDGLTRLDEVVCSDVKFFHAEMMSDGHLWMALDRRDGSRTDINITIRHAGKKRYLHMRGEQVGGPGGEQPGPPFVQIRTGSTGSGFNYTPLVGDVALTRSFRALFLWPNGDTSMHACEVESFVDRGSRDQVVYVSGSVLCDWGPVQSRVPLKGLWLNPDTIVWFEPMQVGYTSQADADRARRNTLEYWKK